MHPAAEALGDRREQQVGADRRLRRDPEQQHQQRRHQRATADAGEADQDADQKAGEGVEQIHRCARPTVSETALRSRPRSDRRPPPAGG